MAALPEGTELLALGPLTNIAAACRIDPLLPSRVGLRVVGGNLSSRGFLPPLWPFEFNFARDRAAARDVLARAWRHIVVYPLDVVRRLRCDATRLERLRYLSPLGAQLAGGSRRWLARSPWRYLARSFPVWDLVAALDAVGELSGRYARRRIREGEFACLVTFDPGAAWRSFQELLSLCHSERSLCDRRKRAKNGSQLLTVRLSSLTLLAAVRAANAAANSPFASLRMTGDLWSTLSACLL